MTMRERIARALSFNNNGSEKYWRPWALDTDVALAAMREPTKAMVEAGDACEATLDVWQAMIDAAKGDGFQVTTSEESGSKLLKSGSSLPVSDGDKADLIRDAWGALNFILAFYEPGQTYLDTEAWKRAEANARAVRERLSAAMNAAALGEPLCHVDNPVTIREN